MYVFGSYYFSNQGYIRELGKFWLPDEEIDQLDSGNMKDDKIQRQIHYMEI